MIEAFGGLSQLARALGSPVSTVQGWKIRGEIPQRHWAAIIKSAADRDIVIKIEDFVLIASAPEAA
ncbi:carph-isopro domain-containing protein [Tianweitania sediminis]|uniref:Uncharacterized protein n=1 Tax=Tianweitania sediminis TaxID=1502156 RepID=A0A8J7R4K9_9HYPH|nr:hypothetical protein [Tianweitania sediminis]MBP0440656.1 hypothetical protein [Tianweitania sediminis]